MKTLEEFPAEVFRRVTFHWNYIAALRRHICERVDALALFDFLDPEGSGLLRPDCLRTRLARPRDIRLFFSHYSRSESLALTEEDFLVAVQSSSILEHSESKLVTLEIVQTFERLVQEEAQMLLGLKRIARKAAEQSPLYDARTFYQLLDPHYEGHISSQRLKSFLQSKNSFSFDPQSVIQCMDLSQKGVISREDFLHFMGLFLESTVELTITRSSCKGGYRQQNSINQHFKRLGSAKQGVCGQKVEARLSEITGLIVKLSAKLEAIEKKEEKSKARLLQCKDFCPRRLFHLFDISRKRVLIPSELQAGMQSLGIKATFKECTQLVRRFDLNKDNKLDNKQFLSIFGETEERKEPAPWNSTTLAFLQHYLLQLLEGSMQAAKLRARARTSCQLRPDHLWEWVGGSGVVSESQFKRVFGEKEG